MDTQSLARPVAPRYVKAGTLDDQHRYVITLESGETFLTDDDAIATTAAAAQRAHKPVDLITSARAGWPHPAIDELQILPPVATPTVEPPSAPPPAAMTPRRPQTVAAAPPALPTGLLKDPLELARKIDEMSAHYNVISPVIAVSEMAQGFGANLAVVRIDPAVTFDQNHTAGAGPDTYYSKFIHQGDEGKRSLNKGGLQKVAQALGIQWDHNHCKRLDDMKTRHFWVWQYVGYLRTHDGNLQTIKGTRELDLREGAEEALQMRSAAQLAQARMRGNEICETKAMQRAIRLFVAQTYTVEQLRKPFVIVRFSFTPDMSDPDIKRLVTERAMSGIGALFSTPPAAILPALPEPADDDGVDAGLVETPPGPISAPPVPPAATRRPNPFAAEDAPAIEDDVVAGGVPDHARRIAKVDTKSGTSAASGRGWKLIIVTFDDGTQAATFDTKIHALVAEAQAKNMPVTVTTEENPGREDKLVSLALVDGRQPSLPMGKVPY